MMVYAGFWKRLEALFVDLLILLPLIGINAYLSQLSRLYHLYSFLPMIIFGLWYFVYLVAKNGGTPGKLKVKLCIVMADGSPVTLRAAVLRYSVYLIPSVLSSVAIIIASLNISDATYSSLGFLAKTQKLQELAPSWYQVVRVFNFLFIWCELLTLLFNKKRRAIHDFIAGTVVIRTDNVNQTPS